MVKSVNFIRYILPQLKKKKKEGSRPWSHRMNPGPFGAGKAPSGCPDQGAQPSGAAWSSQMHFLWPAESSRQQNMTPLGTTFFPRSPGPLLLLTLTYLASSPRLPSKGIWVWDSQFQCTCPSLQMGRLVAGLGLELPGSPVAHFPTHYVLRTLPPQMYPWL